jgi:SAM-dependent methyltransferase
MRPRQVLSAMLSGHLVTQAISVAARLGIPDLVARRPRSIQALARASGVRSDPLYRMLRALTDAGVFAELPRRRFGRTPLSDLLRSGVSGSLRAVALLAGEPWRRASYDLIGALRSSRSPFERTYGMPLYTYLARRPGALRLFTEVMEEHWPSLRRAVLGFRTFARAGTIVDVGGGSGALLAALLAANAAASGIVLDLPAAAAVARRRLAAAGLSRRGRVMVGDFFRRVPRGGDVYVLAFVLHNWDDRRALAILRTCRAAMSEGARLVVIEVIVPRSARPSPARVHDLEMLVFTPGGRERTAAEYRTLLSAAGLRVRRTVTTGTPVSLIEAAPSPARRRPAHPRPRRRAN